MYPSIKNQEGPAITYETYLWPYAQEPSAVQGQIGPKLGELSMKESNCSLNPLEQGTSWVRMHNVYVTNKYCTILPYNGEKTIKVKCPERISV